MKYFLLLLFFSATTTTTTFFAQTLTKRLVVDMETRKIIPDARVIFEDQIYYSNDEGNVLLPSNAKDFEISLSGYVTQIINNFQPIIALKPAYSDIVEVKIINIDVKKIFKDVIKHYDDIYYDKSAMYDVTYSQRTFEDNEMRQLMIADGKFWSRNGEYNFKDGSKSNYDKFVQLQIDDLRYLKKVDYLFKGRAKTSIAPHDNIGNMFLSYHLSRIFGFMNSKDAVVRGRLLYENSEEQEIYFRIKLTTNSEYSGKIIFNKKDKAITYLEHNFLQSNSALQNVEDENGVKFLYQAGDGNFIYDFYKVGSKYVPARISVKSDGFKYITSSKDYIVSA
ncbi:hypothetical protein [Frigoriflavimonas asaccharolytica]|uniref:Carboxypeptidase-like protein n=1 Tax=Frigoriflavimonas asaccharolytica TaxID=2735899 RepID=A0A8J8G8J2_9FLAO|nr:hypothetical protein [Frigoriflavimonas asaccharolytica]NRS93403.1 hypothetical protein [Frigoriflavimonas asaccharolytica]